MSMLSSTDSSTVMSTRLSHTRGSAELAGGLTSLSTKDLGVQRQPIILQP